MLNDQPIGRGCRLQQASWIELARIFFVFVAQQQQRVIDALQHRHRILLEQAREIAALLQRAVERSVLFDDQNGR